jgi:hypothetical protein
MDQSIRDKIADAATEVFSTMYFMSVQLLKDPPLQDNWDLDTTYISARIDFVCPWGAVVRFFFPGRLARNIAEGFLGIDAADISEKQAVDTMKEAANMVIGSFLGKADPDGVCKLGIPTAEVISDFSPANLSQEPELFAFTSEFGYMWMTYGAPESV